MHFLVDLLAFCGSFSAPFVIGFLAPAPYHYLSLASVLLLPGYPLLLQAFEELLMVACSPPSEIHHQRSPRLVYNQEYNLTACGLEKMHPFDSVKYQRVLEKLKREGVVDQIHQVANKPSRAILRQVMDFWYLVKLNYSICVSKYLELPVCFLPSFVLRRLVLDRMLLASQGTIEAACIAIHRGYAINLAGGYHHAKRTHGSGFCIYPDIMMACQEGKRHGKSKIVILDLDAHQGNGYESDLLGESATRVIDFYNPSIYPQDYRAAGRIDSSVYVHHQTTDQQYMADLKKALDVLDSDFLIYNAGTDILQGDPLGGLSITAEGIIRRDQLVFKTCQTRGIPVVMLLSGGYTQLSAEVIARSIRNLSTFLTFRD